MLSSDLKVADLKGHKDHRGHLYDQVNLEGLFTFYLLFKFLIEKVCLLFVLFLLRPPLPDLRRPERQPSQRPFLQPGNDLERFQIKEDTPVGEAVYTLKGIDPKGMTFFLFTFFCLHFVLIAVCLHFYRSKSILHNIWG